MPQVVNIAPIDMRGLLRIAGGHTAFQLLWAGVDLGVFDALHVELPIPFEQLRRTIALAEQPARILMTGLAALGLVSKCERGYRNPPVVASLLTRSSPRNVVAVLGWQAHIVYPGLVDFVASLRANTNIGLRHFPGEGSTLYERLRAQPALEKVFQDAMSGLSQHANARLAEAYDWSAFRHVVDIGGGDATNAIAIARRFLHLRVTVFDAPSVGALATKNIVAAGLEDRVRVVSGDLWADPFPNDADAMLLSHMCTIWSGERNVRLLRKIYEHLPERGAVVIFGMMGNDSEDGPISTALGSPYFLAIATGEGMLHARKDYRQWLTQAGFHGVELTDELPLDHAVAIGRK